MNEHGIQTAINALAADMSERGLRSAQCTAFINANAEPSVYLHWDEDGTSYGRTEIGRGADMAGVLENAREILEAIPPKEDRDKAEFTRLLANAIDKGRAIGIEVEFINPLVATMKRLSENAITHVTA